MWDYENRDEQSVERDESAGSRYADEEERNAAAEAQDDQGRCSTPVKRTYRLFGIFIEKNRICRKQLPSSTQ